MEKFEAHYKEINEYQGKSVQHFIRNVESGTPKIVTITDFCMGRTGGPTQLRQRCWRRSTAILGNPNPGLSQDLALNKTWLSLISGLNFQNFKKTQGIDRLQDTKIQLLAQRNQLLVLKWLN